MPQNRYLSLIFLFVALNITFSVQSQHDASPFVQRKGTKLFAGKEEVRLKGVCFGNEVWSYVEVPVNHHDEQDYKRVADMGMNAVRFYLNYQTFEDDDAPFEYKERGWEWLDRNIAWARKHGVYLILNMHVPQGGFQSQGKGHELWSNKLNQRRLINLWRAIAHRYANEPVIAGYDLLNEPHVTHSITQWESLAKEVTGAIRSVDKNHLIIVERLNAISDDWNSDNGEGNFFLTGDTNTMYTFHFYHPIEYSHQNTPWTGFGDGGKYPDNKQLQFPSDLQWHTATFDNPTLKIGQLNWTHLQGELYRVEDDFVVVGKPTLVASHNTGETYFTDFTITEYDEDQKFIRQVMSVQIRYNDGWAFWSKNGEGEFAIKRNTDFTDKIALVITGTTEDANCYNNNYRFRVKKGHHYAISGWAKVAQMPEKAVCGYRIDFEKSESGGAVLKRNKVYLENELNKYLLFSRKHGVPVFCGEFGLYKDCFRKGKGGHRWVGDMLDLFDKYRVHYTYHAWHEDAFGIYETPDSPNKRLIKTLSDR